MDFFTLNHLLYFQIGEYRLNFDYSPSERYIIDMRNIHIGHLSKLNPVVLKKAEFLCTVSQLPTNDNDYSIDLT